MTFGIKTLVITSFFYFVLLFVIQYLQRRFNSDRVKTAGAVGFLLATMPYMAVVLYGPAIALSSVIRISIPMSILVVGVIVTFYTSIVRNVELFCHTVLLF